MPGVHGQPFHHRLFPLQPVSNVAGVSFGLEGDGRAWAGCNAEHFVAGMPFSAGEMNHALIAYIQAAAASFNGLRKAQTEIQRKPGAKSRGCGESNFDFRGSCWNGLFDADLLVTRKREFAGSSF